MDEKAADKFAKPLQVVTPRKRTFQRLPVIALYREAPDDETSDHMDWPGWALTEDGELMTQQELHRRLPKMPSTLFIRMDAAQYVVKLDAHYRKHYPGTWNCRFITKESNLIAQGFMKPVRETVVCHYFGWQTRGKGDYHKILDPLIFLEKKIPHESGKPYIQTLLEWGVAVRDFCDDSGIEVRATAGAISSQFLTDPRFYPNARRKVPRATNERVREVLPGNYYSLTVVPRGDREYTAYYMDQHSAHHYHAQRLALPHSDELYAYGRFDDLAECVFDGVWDNFHGLYCLDLAVSENRANPRWIRDWLHHRVGEPGVLEKRYVYSNELQHLYDHGYRVIGVRAAWGSHKRDEGLNQYAAWASQQLEERGRAPWLKRLLLATYGALAIAPKDSVSLYARAKKGEFVSVRVGAETFTGRKIQQRMKLEPRFANVLHRGMIEAACRSYSIGYATYLEGKGYYVLSIYSDAVVVEVNDDLPEPPELEPWRLKRTLHHLRFINAQAYQSAEESKIPGGIGREILKYIQQSPGHAPRPTNTKWSST